MARNKTNGSTNAIHQRTLLFVGSKSSGKTTLINYFLEKTEPVKKTLTLDYMFVRKQSSHSLAKDVCHIWELGGGSKSTSVLGNGNLLSNYGPLTAVIMLDLSELDQLWLNFETLIDNLKSLFTNSTTPSTYHQEFYEHTDFSMMTPFPVPLLVIGGKYDIFQKYDPEKKKIVCRCLRYVCHILCASLLFYSSNDASLVKRVKDLLNHYAFNAPFPKTSCKEYNKAICIPQGSDLLESIEGVRPTTKSSLDRARHFFTTHFPQDASKLTSTILDNPSNDPNYTEPLIDALRREKQEELERYCQEMERREKRATDKVLQSTDF